MPSVDILLSRLEKVRANGRDSWVSCCPAHADKTPSLSITLKDDRILVYCHAQCGAIAIMQAVGLTLGDLFDGPVKNHPSMLHARPRRFPDDIGRVSLDEWVQFCGDSAPERMSSKDLARYRKALTNIARQQSRGGDEHI